MLFRDTVESLQWYLTQFLLKARVDEWASTKAVDSKRMVMVEIWNRMYYKSAL